ncbi:MAG: cation-translocating P-type ATPase [Candidatus Saccharibacteria bacterium]|nr:cation-translocating P-type ATPase [Candidatus Saccharibacteria bacterium]
MRWFQKSEEDVVKEFLSNTEHGLSSFIAQQRLNKFGKNQLESGKKINPIGLFLNQFKDVLIIILLIAAVVSWLVGLISGSTEEGGGQEALLIFFIVIAIAIIGFLNEYKAEKTVEALKKLVGHKTKIRRDGKIIEVDAVDIVQGDIVILDEGAKIPADIRLLQVRNLQINESSLTGESLPVSKDTKSIIKDALLGDQKNMAFAGTFVTQGTAEGIVVATGSKTELGKIASLVSDIDNEQTPMQKKLDDLGKRLGLMIVFICVIVFVIVLLFVDEARDRDFIQRIIFAFTAAVALAVAAIPEGLAFVVRISLALGARRMASKNALVRRLSAVEALGSTDIICTDKTGTLTKGEMTVREVYVGSELFQVTGTGYGFNGEFRFNGKKANSNSNLEQLLLIGAICNNSRIDKSRVIGDPTEGALLVSAAKSSLDYENARKELPRLNEVPFNSDRKFMSTVHRQGKSYLVAAKGSVESTLDRCQYVLDGSGKVIKMTTSHRLSIIEQNKKYSTDSLRVLAFAQKKCSKLPKNDKEIEKDLVFVGLQAMMDPPRSEVADVIKRVQSEAGMRVIMITGDYIETAKAIAKEIGIVGDAVSGADLESMTHKEFEERVEKISVYARVNPEHKIRIVKALKKQGHQVAMTGDGVNDAPAIKAADIGIAMGITGTDAAKEAADLILLDDQFLTIINAIEEGRGIFDNVRKFVNFLISCNIAEVFAVLFGILFFNNLLLTAAQLLFINIITDGLPAIALGSDPSRSDVLKSSPNRFQESILTKRVWTEIFIFGLLMSGVLMFQYWYNLANESSLSATSGVFTAMVVYEFVRLVDIRTDYKIKWFSNPMLSISMAASLVLQLVILYVPIFSGYFNVSTLKIHDWFIMFIGAIVLFVIMKLINPILDKFVGLENHPHNSII